MDNDEKADIKNILAFIEKQGEDKLKEIPVILRDMAAHIEHRLEHAKSLYEANHIATVQLRELDSLLGLLRESVSAKLWDHTRIVCKYLEEE